MKKDQDLPNELSAAEFSAYKTGVAFANDYPSRSLRPMAHSPFSLATELHRLWLLGIRDGKAGVKKFEK